MPDFFTYCPHCKSNELSKDETKRFICKHCGFQYYHNVASACAVILYYEDRILFVVRKYDPAKGSLDLPGGFVDYNENIEDALKREVKEELNLDIKELNYLASFPNQYVYMNVNYHTLDFIFSSRIDSLEGIVVNDDVADYVLLGINEIEPDQIGLHSIRKAVGQLVLKR